MTYIIYLAPANSSGYNVCPRATVHCIEACLNESGHNRIDVSNRINQSRIIKTKLFYADREFFMEWVVREIEAYKKQADVKGMRFSVRLNGTSDLNPELFKYNGKSLLELFPQCNSMTIQRYTIDQSCLKSMTTTISPTHSQVITGMSVKKVLKMA